VPYGVVAAGEWGGFIQTGEYTCAHAALAFFLTGAGFPATEEDIIRETGKRTMLSLRDMQEVTARRGLKSQALRVAPRYFQRHPTAAILHFSSKHFVVFMGETDGDPEIFDPAYGKVFVSWQTLRRLFSGAMLYIYQ